MAPRALIGDIGGTNARFALVEHPGRFSRPRVLPTHAHASLAAAISAYLADEQLSAPPPQAVLAVASPITGDDVVLTNHPWSLSIGSLRQQLGVEKLRVINDFVACALAIPHLGERDRVQIGGGVAVDGAPIGIIGPGTGLGVSALMRINSEVVPLESEGGHVTLAAETAREATILGAMRRRFDHVSAERILSGPGLVNLYNVLCELSGAPAGPLTAAQITSQITGPTIGNEERQRQEAKALFCAMLGSTAGNLALTLGARGGVYIAGGIAPRIIDDLRKSEFRRRFEAKGRLCTYLAAIPTYVIVHAWPALLGASHLV